MQFASIIVGAGFDGCLLANQFSANRQFRVCLIEVGPSETSPFIHILAGASRLEQIKD